MHDDLMPFCFNCRFFSWVAPPPANGKGQCRRHAPATSVASENIEGGVPFWPVVGELESCGDWEEGKPMNNSAPRAAKRCIEARSFVSDAPAGDRSPANRAARQRAAKLFEGG